MVVSYAFLTQQFPGLAFTALGASIVKHAPPPTNRTQAPDKSSGQRALLFIPVEPNRQPDANAAEKVPYPVSDRPCSNNC